MVSLIIADYQGTRRPLSFDANAEAPLISQKDRRSRGETWEGNRPLLFFVAYIEILIPRFSPARYASHVAQYHEMMSRLVYVAANLARRYHTRREGCLQLFSHDKPYYRRYRGAHCAIPHAAPIARAVSRENNNRHVIPYMTHHACCQSRAFNKCIVYRIVCTEPLLSRDQRPPPVTCNLWDNFCEWHVA